jgi:hypothetical protein
MGKIDRNIEESDSKRSIGFSASPVFPGEDQKEFEGLVAELCGQYEPVGPAENDAVKTMAKAIFRKRHPEIFQRAFEARLKWGAFFEFPGDPHGSARINEHFRQQANMAYIDATTKYAMEKVKSELAKVTDTTKLIQCETERTSEAANLFATKGDNENSTAEDILNANVKGIVEKSVAEIKEKGSKRFNRGARNSEDVAEIVKSNTKIAFEASIKQQQRNGFKSRHEYEARKSEAVDKLIAVMEATFGPGTMKEMLEPICREGIEQSLAELGDLLTPERYAAELQFNELLDAAIERSHDRLMKYQAARTKKLSGSINSLQPGWARKR